MVFMLSSAIGIGTQWVTPCAVNQIFRTPNLPPRINDNHLVLIPKTKTLETIDQFRPIS